MKKKTLRSENVMFRATPQTLEKLDYYADKLQISRSLLIHNILVGGVDDLVLMEKTGLLAMGASIVKFRDHLRDNSGKDNNILSST